MFGHVSGLSVLTKPQMHFCNNLNCKDAASLAFVSKTHEQQEKKRNLKTGLYQSTDLDKDKKYFCISFKLPQAL